MYIKRSTLKFSDVLDLDIFHIFPIWSFIFPQFFINLISYISVFMLEKQYLIIQKQSISVESTLQGASRVL